MNLAYNGGRALWLEVSKRRDDAHAELRWVTAWALVAGAGTRPPSRLTVVMDFQGSHSSQSIGEMERETEGILRTAGLQLEWRLPPDAARETFNDLVLVQFKGGGLAYIEGSEAGGEHEDLLQIFTIQIRQRGTHSALT